MRQRCPCSARLPKTFFEAVRWPGWHVVHVGLVGMGRRVALTLVGIAAGCPPVLY